MKYLSLILASIVILLGAFVSFASAQNYIPLAPLPIAGGSTPPPSYTMTTYLAGAIKLLLAIGASIAILMTVVGGTQYVAAGISPDAKSEAKNRIQNSFIGLALMLVSYLILNSINPKLVQFNLSLEKKEMVVERTPLDVGLDSIFGETAFIRADTKNSRVIDDAIKNCATYAADITPFTIGLSTQEAIGMEAANGNKVLFTAMNDRPDHTLVQSNLDKLNTEVEKLKTALAKKGASATVTSAYRPYEYQRHLFYIWRAWTKEGLKNNTAGECLPAKNAIRIECSKHTICNTSVVADPDGQGAPHTRGRGVDIKLTGIEYADIQAFMDKEGVGLKWGSIPGDDVHFDLKRGI